MGSTHRRCIGVVGCAFLMALTACRPASDLGADRTPVPTVTVTVEAVPSEGSESSQTPLETPVPEMTQTPAPPQRFTLSCSVETGRNSEVTEDVAYSTVQRAWADKRVKRSCTVEYNSPDPYKPLGPRERKILALGKKSWSSSGELAEVFEVTAIQICAQYPYPKDDLESDPLSSADRSWLRVALVWCPKAPHAKEMAGRAVGSIFDDGTYVVGEDIEPGRYRSTAPANDCYWERTTDNGQTVDNDFVTFAPRGALVRIGSEDGGFSSQRCGTWRRVK